jgi:hypothetical protein
VHALAAACAEGLHMTWGCRDLQVRSAKLHSARLHATLLSHTASEATTNTTTLHAMCQACPVYAVLCCAVLCCAVLRCAVMCCAEQSLRPKLSDEQKRQLEECYELMDADGSGAIDADELGAAFKVRCCPAAGQRVSVPLAGQGSAMSSWALTG